ncbi:MAG: hypothetical protein QGH25_22590 [Candidatus Latescibacteria bacterium]|jgi:hypothetical protein|nr:hypothetical protein [Candidatus Latescibacterota bacterium]
MLSKQQKCEFVEDGYLVIPGAVPQVMIAEALGADAYLDIWKEWDGVQEVVAGEAVPRYNQ